MTCFRCHAPGRAGLRFCESCGAALSAACPQCAAPIIGPARFCGTGGAAFVAAGDGPASLSAYTPPYVAERILTSRCAREGERKQATVLFCDFSSFTALAERIGAEAMHRLLDEFFELALTEVHRYGGTINQFLGDGFMALFGAPLAREDHARRAVLAALGLRCALRERAPGATHRHLDLDVRMGLNSGLVVVGRIGHNLRTDYTAVGSTTPVAHRLEQIAEPGTILITEATHRLVGGYVLVTDLGEQPIKGKADPVHVYEVVGPGARRSRLKGPDRTHLTPLVGREREIGTLRCLLERAEGGAGQVVAVSGESGIGKSRLFHEFSQLQLGRPVTFLEGRCLSYGQSIPYLPVLDILRQGRGIKETDSPEAIQAKVEWAMGDI